MNFCQGHWDMLREAVIARGLGDLIAPDGQTAVAQLADQLDRAEATKTNYDPLMSAMFAISDNAMRMMKEAGADPLYLLMGGGPEAPVATPGFEGRIWPRCPLCHINLAHEIFCDDPECTIDKERGYDVWIDRAADDQVEAWNKIKAGDAA